MGTTATGSGFFTGGTGKDYQCFFQAIRIPGSAYGQAGAGAKALPKVK
jgi:hypothetical protein